jgi:uncharacterized protein
VQIRIEHIVSSPTDVHFNVDAQTLNGSLNQRESGRDGRDGTEYLLTSPLQVALSHVRSGQDLLFDGTLRGDLVCQCARCLEEFPLSLDRPFSCVFMPLASPSPVGRLPSRELELNHEDLSASFYSGDSVDVSALVQEQFLLALPSRLLCQDECKGLCEQCGVNLNVETCTCRPVWKDPRLAVLSTLRVSSPETSALQASSQKREKLH